VRAQLVDIDYGRVSRPRRSRRHTKLSLRTEINEAKPFLVILSAAQNLLARLRTVTVKAFLPKDRSIKRRSRPVQQILRCAQNDRLSHYSRTTQYVNDTESASRSHTGPIARGL